MGSFPGHAGEELRENLINGYESDCIPQILSDLSSCFMPLVMFHQQSN